jgi:hypothetical protein
MTTLIDFVGLILANFNMIQSPQDFQTGNVDMFGNGTWGLQAVSVGTGFIAPDGSTTAQSLIENSASGEHYDQTPNTGSIAAYGFGSSTVTNVGYPFRFTLIAKAGSRSRIVIALGGTFQPEASFCYDLAGGNFGFSDTVTVGWTLIANGMTSLGNGWWKIQLDVSLVTSNAFDWFLKLKLDNGSGTAARSTNYTGNGTGNVLLWFLGMLPKAAQTTLGQQTYFSDFSSIGEIDINDTQAAGFNWYPHNRWPGFTEPASNIQTAPTTPSSAIHVSNSILTLDRDVSGYGSGLMSACVDPHNNNAFIGSVFTIPAVFEARMTYDKTSPSIQNNTYGGSSIAWWAVNVECLVGGNRILEIDHMEASTGGTTFKSSMFDDTIAPPSGAEFQNQVGPHPANTSTFINVATMILSRSTDANNLGCKLNFYNGHWAPNSFQPIWTLQTTPPNDFTEWDAGQHITLIIGAGSGATSTPPVNPVNAPVQFDYVRVFGPTPPPPPPLLGVPPPTPPSTVQQPQPAAAMPSPLPGQQTTRHLPNVADGTPTKGIRQPKAASAEQSPPDSGFPRSSKHVFRR